MSEALYEASDPVPQVVGTRVSFIPFFVILSKPLYFIALALFFNNTEIESYIA